MKLHELLDYIRPTQTIRVVTYGWGEDYLTLVEDKLYNEVTLIDAYEYMLDEVMELEAIDGVLVIVLADDDEIEEEDDSLCLK